MTRKLARKSRATPKAPGRARPAYRQENRMKSAPVSTASRIQRIGPRRERKVPVGGMGRIAQRSIDAPTYDSTLGVGTGGLADGDIVVDVEITPGLFPRLSKMASAYQRYKFTKLNFVVQPMCPSTAGGGYVAGFIADPTDTKSTFDKLQATGNSFVKKWWETSEVRSRAPKELLWTSAGTTQRLFSPGRFVVIAVGKSTQTINLSVMCDWAVELEVPSLEEEAEELEFTTTRAFHESDLTSGESSVLAKMLFDSGSKPTKGQYLVLPYPLLIEYNFGSGDVINAKYFHMKAIENDAGLPSLEWGVATRGTEGSITWEKGVGWYSDSEVNQCLMPEGTVLKIMSPN